MARLGTIFLFITLIIPIISEQCNYKTATPYFKRSIYEFTLKLVKRINQETEGHFVASALSPWTLLSAMSLGASDTTLKIMQNVLHLHPDRCFNNLYFALARKLTMKPSNPTLSKLERSSTIFFDESLHVKPIFFVNLTKAGICEARIVPFVDTIGTAATINGHVGSDTNEAIDEMVTPEDLDGILTVMVDALYFKGAWKVPFPYEDIETRAFYNDKYEQIGDVSMMYVSGSFNVLTIPYLQAQVLELPYEDDCSYSMLIFLPNPNVTITTMVNLMGNNTITSIFRWYKMYGPLTAAVQIPRFKISSDNYKLKKHFIDMGLKTIFDQQANFAGISNYPLYLSDVIQKAEIEVTEDGTVAAAATMSLFESRLLSDQFDANRPFMFMIIDRILHVPIFTGAYSKPSILCDWNETEIDKYNFIM